MKPTPIITAVLLACLTNVSNAASTWLEPDCPVLPGLQSTKSLADLPAPVMAALREHVPDLAPAEAAFFGGDALVFGQSGASRRFVSAFHRGARWTVMYEAGGRATNDHVVAIQLSPDMQTAQILANIQSSGAEGCVEMVKWTVLEYPISRIW